MNERVSPKTGNTLNDLLSRAMRLLSQRDHSEDELRRKLAAQPFSPAPDSPTKIPPHLAMNPSTQPLSNKSLIIVISIIGWTIGVLLRAISVAAAVRATARSAFVPS